MKEGERARTSYDGRNLLCRFRTGFSDVVCTRSRGGGDDRGSVVRDGGVDCISCRWEGKTWWWRVERKFVECGLFFVFVRC